MLLHFHDDLSALPFARMKNNGTARRGVAGIGTAAMGVALEAEFFAPKFVEQKNRCGSANDAECDNLLPIHVQKIL